MQSNQIHLIAIVDDSWPAECLLESDSDHFEYKKIREMVKGQFDWPERAIESFLRKLVARAEKISQVEIIGFYALDLYLNAVIKADIRVPNMVVIDWDFGTDRKAGPMLGKILAQEGLEHAYVFSRDDNMDEIMKLLVKPEIINSKVAVHLYNKGNRTDQGASLNKLVDRLLRKVEDVDGRTFSFASNDTTFRVSKYLNHYIDFWKVAAIVGEKELLEKLSENQFVVDENLFKSTFQESMMTFFVDRKNNLLLTTRNPRFENSDYELSEVSAINALEEFGLDKLEKAVERSIVRF